MFPSVGTIAKLDLNKNAQFSNSIQLNWQDGTSWTQVRTMVSRSTYYKDYWVHDGFIKNRYGSQLLNDEAWWIPPGSASVIESTFPEEKIAYVGLDHAMTTRWRML